MKLTIKDVRQASSTEWDTIWGGCGYATFLSGIELQCSQKDETNAINLLDGFDAVH